MRASATDTLFSFTRAEVDEINKVLDENEIYSWQVEQYELIIEQKNIALVSGADALETCKSEVKISNELYGKSSDLINDYETQIIDLGLSNDKYKRKTKRNRWMAIGAGVAGILLGVYIAK